MQTIGTIMAKVITINIHVRRALRTLRTTDTVFLHIIQYTNHTSSFILVDEPLRYLKLLKTNLTFQTDAHKEKFKVFLLK